MAQRTSRSRCRYDTAPDGSETERSGIELASPDHHGRARHLHRVEARSRAADPGEEHARTADLDALRDLDLLAERNEPVSGEMVRERTGGRSGGGVLAHPETGPEHPRLPASARAGEAVDADHAELSERRQVGAQPCDLVLALERCEDVADPVVIDLDRKA